MSQREAASITETAESLLAIGRYEEAYALAKEAIAADPGAYYPYCLAARAQRGSHGPQAAELFFKKALACDPREPYVHRLASINYDAMAGLHRGSRRDDVLVQALGHAEEAVRLAPSDPLNLVQMAHVYGELDYFDKAGAALVAAIETAPTSAQVWATATSVAILARNWRAAERAARRCLAIDPDRADVRNGLGVALRRQGRSVLGLIAFGDAATKNPTSPVARRNVDSAGYELLRSVGLYLLVPLLIFPPVLYWALRAARYASYARLSYVRREPESLRPLARWVGLRLAHSALLKRHFERGARRAQARLGPAAQWSLHKQPLVRLVGLAMMASCFGVGVIAFLGAFQIAAHVGGGWWLPAVIGFLMVCVAVVRFLWRRGAGRL